MDERTDSDAAPSEPALKKDQALGLWLGGRAPLLCEADAALFLQSVRIALRYNATPSLPLAAMHTAAGDVQTSTVLTNALLASGVAIETNLIADRLVLLHRSIAPAVYALRRRKTRPLALSVNAQRALGLIERNGHATSGEVRRFLGVAGLKRPDPADDALTELQRELMVDRGPSSIPKNGIPYLSPEGFPYRIFEQAHPEVVHAAQKLTIGQAATGLVEAYLQAAVLVTPRKLAAMFRLLLSEEEIAAIASKQIERTKKYLLFKTE